MRFVILLFLTFSVILTGCVSSKRMKSPPPKCNGYNKRPLNRSMWDWQDKSAVFINNFARDENNSGGEIFTPILTLISSSETLSGNQISSLSKSFERCE